jgi:hypothetical protein
VRGIEGVSGGPAVVSIADVGGEALFAGGGYQGRHEAVVVE